MDKSEESLSLVFMYVLPAKAVAGGESESDSPVFTADRLYEFSLLTVVFRQSSLQSVM